MGGGALRGFGKTLGYGMGGSLLGSLIGTGLDVYQQSDDDDVADAADAGLSGLAGYTPYNAIIGSIAGK